VYWVTSWLSVSWLWRRDKFACTIRVCYKSNVVRFLIYKHCRLSCSFRFSYLVLYFPYCIMINLNLVAANYSRGSNRLSNHCPWNAANIAWIFITFSFKKCLLPLLGLEFIAESRVLFTDLTETVTCFTYYFAIIIFQTPWEKSFLIKLNLCCKIWTKIH